MYDYNAYQARVLALAKVMSYKEDLIHACLGLVSEAGELADALKAYMVYGRPVDVLNMQEEVGDGMWFSALLARLMQFDFFAEVVEPACTRAAIIEPSRVYGYVLRLADSGGRLSERITNHVEHDWPLHRDFVLAELQRYVNYLMRISVVHGFTLGDACDGNIAKLVTRYGDKFDAQAALNRDKEAEREAIAGATAA